MSGDVTIGGLFDIHIYYKTEAFNFSSPPHLQPRKISMLLEDFYNFLNLVFAVDEINRNPNILPNVSLGYNVYDSYVDLFRTVQGAVRIYSGNTKQYPNYNCDKYGALAAVIEGMASSFSIQYANIFGVYKYPQISFMSQEPLQSNKLYFPSFYRTVPSEKTLYSAVIALLKHFGWMWVGIIYPDDDGSINAIKIIKNLIVENGGCIEFIKLVPSINDFSPERIKEIEQTVAKSSANVILVYGSKNYVYYLELNVHVTSIPGKVWIHTAESSFRMFNLENDTSVNGSLRFIMQKNENPAFIKFIKEVNPGMSYNVYNSVYAVAYALWEMYQQIPMSERLNDTNKLKFQDLKGWKLHKFLRKVNFTNPLGQDIFFSDGEFSVGYDIYNVIHYPNWTINSQRIGSFDFHASLGKQIILNKSDIVWEKKFSKIPRSVCSDICLPGNRKSIREGQPVCCYDCLPCPEGQISNKTDVDVCIKCPEDEWPNQPKTICIKKDLTFLSYEDPIGVVLTVIALLFSVASAAVLGTFIKNQQTPIVKANNRDLSYVILLSLMLSCLCCLIFIERPQRATCFLRQAIFGITFAISVSSLLAKTLIVVIAFNATKPGKNLRKWVGAKVPKYIVFTCSVIQVLICIAWFCVTPPSIYYNKQSEVERIILECDKESAIAFYIILGYLCILSSVCFIVAFFARKLPDTFNDAKLITFSMLVFFSVWVFFIPTYLSAKGKSTVAVEVFAILASSSGMLCSVFAPKCYIILIKPHKNKKNLVLKGTM
ncbi:vomeronasal type-2 receptor 26-like [Anomaloglossus baeobatrachus]|uniref:vomeronasal type-2 receptor 26-like n=1 Tax=Anomaloglossus baeobatrachus TaxID=238106 RepID=UPI003F4FA190